MTVKQNNRNRIGSAAVCRIMTGILLTIFLEFAISNLALAEDTPATRETLRGLPGVGVSVYVEANGMPEIGDLSTLLRTETQMKLRMGGIQVFDEQTISSQPSTPVLTLSVMSLQNESGILTTYAVYLEFLQQVALIQNPNRKILAPTWSGTFRMENFNSEISGVARLDKMRQDVRAEVQKFIAAFQSVNP